MDTNLARQLPHDIIMKIIRLTSDAKSEHQKRFKNILTEFEDWVRRSQYYDGGLRPTPEARVTGQVASFKRWDELWWM